ncbi:glutathione S-transferase family protein [Sphingomonas montana]|uniref:glutathione S-transferase family protein n=1 Tax=Sphingomonas montana TaxID=1843236 RepID=UPI00096DF014|nr:glutathione S-transferase family protein [Sphingomonas montana]
MILYGSSFSPFVRKVLAFAAEKDVAIDLHRIGRASTDPAFREANPLGKMPALRDGDYLLADSSAIVAYIEALHPEPALIPAEPRARGMALFWDEFGDAELFDAVRPMFFNRVVRPRFEGKPGDLAAADASEADVLPGVLAYLEARIPESLFLVEDRITLADLAVASPLVNLEHAGGVLDGYPRISAYLAAMLARPSFAGLVAKERAMLARMG